jgi:hypothetical protein
MIPLHVPPQYRWADASHGGPELSLTANLSVTNYNLAVSTSIPLAMDETNINLVYGSCSPFVHASSQGIDTEQEEYTKSTNDP